MAHAELHYPLFQEISPTSLVALFFAKEKKGRGRVSQRRFISRFERQREKLWEDAISPRLPDLPPFSFSLREPLASCSAQTRTPPSPRQRSQKCGFSPKSEGEGKGTKEGEEGGEKLSKLGGGRRKKKKLGKERKKESLFFSFSFSLSSFTPRERTWDFLHVVKKEEKKLGRRPHFPFLGGGEGPLLSIFVRKRERTGLSFLCGMFPF